MLLTVIYDNYSDRDELQADWGFACVVQGLPATILFDTGARGDILLANMGELGIEADKIEAVVLSHGHWDHTGGLEDFLRASPGVRVLMPAVFSQALKDRVRQAGATLVETTDPESVCPNALTTGVVAGGIPEQGLCLQTAQGLVVITGCAHPGIVRMARAAGALAGETGLYAVLGGSHMHAMDRRQITRITEELKGLGIRRAGPCHCSGDAARKVMREAFGDDYIDVKVGACLDLTEP